MSSTSMSVPTIILTNTPESSNQIIKQKKQQHDDLTQDIIIYENDFDLYTLVKDMTKIKQQQSEERKKRKIYFKDTSKLLTAKLSHITHTDGKMELEQEHNESLMYSKQVKCIGTNVEDFAQSEIVSFDLQALSTRIKLMCKMIIIIQGACLERYGPPKLVQDRCVQFDGEVDLRVRGEQTNEPLKKTAVRSASYENLLEIENNEYVSEAVKMKQRLTKKRKESAPQVFKIKGGTASEVNTDDDEKDRKKSNVISQKKYDLENYYRHRMSKYSLKDYASVPYYQYSGRHVTKSDIAINTDESFLQISSTQQNQSTSTCDLLDAFQIGYFSKTQLLSNKSLYREQSSLSNAFCEAKDPSIKYKSEYYYSYTKKYFVSPGVVIETLPNQMHFSGINIQTSNVSKQRPPQKSTKWTLFNRIQKLPKKQSINSLQRTSSVDSPRTSKCSIASSLSKTVKF